MLKIKLRHCFSILIVSACLLPVLPVQAGDLDPDIRETGKTLFLSGATPACAICHTLQDAGSTGTIGPDLDSMNLDVETIKRTLIEGTGVMPSFADTLTDEERDAVARYVVDAISR